MMRAKPDGFKGFTLIELLVTLAVLSLVLAISYYFYFTLSSRWGEQSEQFESNLSELRHQTILRVALKGTMPWVVVDAQDTPSFFFVGNETDLLAITDRGIFNRDYPEIFRLSIVRNESGTLDIVYQARTTQNFVLTGTDQYIPFEHEVTLFRGLSAAEFAYFGWDNLSVKSEGVARPRWFDRYSGIDRQLMPGMIILSLSDQDRSLQLVSSINPNVELWLAPYLDDLI